MLSSFPRRCLSCDMIRSGTIAYLLAFSLIPDLSFISIVSILIRYVFFFHCPKYILIF